MVKKRTVNKHYDVVVVGGGMSGICAGIAAARHNAKTAIIQARPMYGGNASSEIRMHIHGAGCIMSKENLSETGIIEELLLENKSRNPYQVFSIWDTVLWEKVHFQKNLDGYLNTTMESCEKTGDRITSVTCYQYTTETFYTFTADIFVDATGNGTLGFLAGAEYRIGCEAASELNEPNAKPAATKDTMGNTLLFQAVDRGHPVQFTRPFWAHRFDEQQLQYRSHYNATFALGENGEAITFREGNMKALPEIYELDSGYWWIEIGGDFDDIIADGESIRDELLKCVYGVWDHIKNFGEHGAENYDLIWVGFVPGTRESRRLVGDYLINENDIRSNRIFQDAVAYGGWPMDEHTPGGIFDFDKRPSRIFNFDGVYTIPYRCYYSKNISNLMMAGRNISATKLAMASARVMGTCAVGGQAAGTAAALAIKYGCTPREVAEHMTELQQLLLKNDCYIPGYRNIDPSDLARTAIVKATSHIPGCEPEKAVNGVARQVEHESNCWESTKLTDRGETLTLQLKNQYKISCINLTFDPNLTKQIMPSISKRAVSKQSLTTPCELVKDYTLRVFNHEECVYSKEVFGNYQRLNTIDIPENVIGDRIEINITATNGYPNARIYEVRVY